MDASDKKMLAKILGKLSDKLKGGQKGGAQGTVKSHNKEKGFGFITPNDTGNDVYFHFTGTKNSELNVGQEVTFDITKIKGKTTATNIKKLV